MRKIGLKTCWHAEQIKTRIPHQPKILEIYLYDGDLEKNMGGIERGIAEMKKSGAEITIHQPEFYKAQVMTIASRDKTITKNALEGYKKITNLCQKHKLKGFILHPYSGNTDKRKVAENFQKLDKETFISNLNQHKVLKKYAYLENIANGFFSEEKEIKEVKKITQTKLCIDLCHLYMLYQNNKKIEQFIKSISDKNDYFHIVDAAGPDHDSLEIGKGKINFQGIKKYIHQGIIEVNCQNQVTAEEMIGSYYKFKKITKRANIENIKSITLVFKKIRQPLKNFHLFQGSFIKTVFERE